MKKAELIIFVLILAAVNLPLLSGSANDGLAYLPGQVESGQVYRLLTHPFVHVSLYHLLIDGLAFFLLYIQLEETSAARRMAYLLGIHVSVLAAVTLFSPLTSSVGYCGLSGIDHGLMALIGFQQLAQKDGAGKKAACFTLGILVAKSAYELLSGKILFAFLHLGYIGIPVAASHAGGILGAAIMYALFNRKPIQQFIFSRKRQLAFSGGR